MLKGTSKFKSLRAKKKPDAKQRMFRVKKPRSGSQFLSYGGERCSTLQQEDRTFKAPAAGATSGAGIRAFGARRVSTFRPISPTPRPPASVAFHSETFNAGRRGGPSGATTQKAQARAPLPPVPPASVPPRPHARPPSRGLFPVPAGARPLAFPSSGPRMGRRSKRRPSFPPNSPTKDPNEVQKTHVSTSLRGKPRPATECRGRDKASPQAPQPAASAAVTAPATPALAFKPTQHGAGLRCACAALGRGRGPLAGVLGR